MYGYTPPVEFTEPRQLQDENELPQRMKEIHEMLQAEMTYAQEWQADNANWHRRTASEIGVGDFVYLRRGKMHPKRPSGKFDESSQQQTSSPAQATHSNSNHAQKTHHQKSSMANQNTESNVSWTCVGHDNGSSTLYYGPDMTNQPGNPGITYRTPQQPLTTSTTTTQANSDDEHWVLLSELEVMKQATEVAPECLEAMAPRHIIKKSLFLIKSLLPNFKQRIHHAIANPQTMIGIPSHVHETLCYVHDDHKDRLREIYWPSHDERFNDIPWAFLYGIRAETHNNPLLTLTRTYHRNHASMQDDGRIGHETTIIDLTKHWYNDYQEPSPTENKTAVESQP
ncbi:MAG: hypothetical protein M1816_004016 [Peltula sp. TS41687]|nr:MAG: hypothetical protein M1816_004016 [Peltula sp. TS41687]